MRESKYRAWIKNADKMVDVIAIDLEKEEICWIFDDYVNWEQERVWIGFDDIALMQYTGLKDKNGKEVYEGDIVKCTDGADEISELNPDTGIGKIEWLEEWGFWSISNIENGLGDISNNGYVEIIGNIHEKPELMAQTNDWELIND